MFDNPLDAFVQCHDGLKVENARRNVRNCESVDLSGFDQALLVEQIFDDRVVVAGKGRQNVDRNWRISRNVVQLKSKGIKIRFAGKIMDHIMKAAKFLLV